MNMNLRQSLVPYTGLLTTGLLTAGLSAAQTPTALVETGDVLAGIGVVTRIDDVSINSAGDWIVEVDTDNPVTAEDNAIIENGVVVFQEGSSLGIPASVGGVLSSGDRMTVSDTGNSMYLLRVNLTAGGSEQVVIVNGNLVMQSALTPCTAAGAPAGAIWDSLAEVWIDDLDRLLVGGRLDTGEDLICTVDFDSMTGAIGTQTIVVIDGGTLAGHNTPIQGLSLSRRRNGINGNGDVLWFVDDENTTAGGVPNDNICCDSWLYVNGMPILHEGDPTLPTVSDVIGSLSSGEADINDAGQWAAQIGQNPSSFNEDVILRSDGTIFAAEGMAHPAIPVGTVINSLGSSSGVFISNSGDVVYHGQWDDPNADINNGIFFNQTLFLQEGLDSVNGVPIDTIQASDNTIEVSKDGTKLIVELLLDNGQSGAYVYDLNVSVGSNYCVAANNSTGGPGSMGATGSVAVADNTFTLRASGLPVNQFGIFVTSTVQGFVPGVNGTSNGNLCLAGSIGRFTSAAQIVNSGAAGEFALQVDLNQFPQGLGTVMVMSGETWNFQAWHRDNVGLASNFTDGLSVSFL